MRVAFGKIHHQVIPFEKEGAQYSIKGTLSGHQNQLVKLESQLRLSLKLVCDRCGNEFDKDETQTFECLVSNGAYEGFDETYDVIESLDGFVDIDEIVDSEVNLIKSDYNYCSNCK